MSIETINNRSTMAYRNVLAASAYSPSVLGKMESDLRADGALLEGAGYILNDATFTVMLGSFAAEKVIGYSPEAAQECLDGNAVYLGGVCALSTRESTLLGRGKIESPVESQPKEAQEDPELSDAVTAVQVFETIGLTDDPSAIVLEDTLWSNRVIEKLRASTGLDEEDAEQARFTIETRNARTAQALQRLRNYIFEAPSDLVVVRDTPIMDELRQKTDKMLADLGLPPDNNDYRLVYGGMYSYVWREIMESQGAVGTDQLAMIYEPWKHFAPEDGKDGPITNFRRQLLKQAPYMQPGSPAERIGLMVYMEPRDPNGRILRKSVPMALLPNSENYADFDFSKFPVVPKKTNALPDASEFQYVDDIANLTLNKNPAFLWGLAYPPTETTQTIMSVMVRLSAEAKEKSKAVFQVNSALSAKQKQQLSLQVRGAFSSQMQELSEVLIQEIQAMNSAMFGADNET